MLDDSLQQTCSQPLAPEINLDDHVVDGRVECVIGEHSRGSNQVARLAVLQDDEFIAVCSTAR